MFLCSNSLSELFDALLSEVDEIKDDISIIRATIVVPHLSIQTYLESQLSLRKKTILRIKIISVEEYLCIEHIFAELLVVQFFQEHAGFFAEITDPYSAASFWKIPLFARLMQEKKEEEEPLFQRIVEKFLPWWESVVAKPVRKDRAPLFFFGFSSMSDSLLHQVIVRSPQRVYILSPCMLFWGDLASDAEASYIIGKFSDKNVSRSIMEGIESLFLDRQKLLANCGTLGKEFLNLLVEHGCHLEGRYVLHPSLFIEPYEQYVYEKVLPSGVKELPTLLDYVKADLLTLSGGGEEKKEIFQDTSIEIHANPSCLHEVYSLRKTIESTGTLRSQSALVLCTDLQRYKQILSQVFGEKNIYYVAGSFEKGGVIEAFFSLISLLQGPSRSADWLHLVSMEPIYRALGLDKDGSLELMKFLSSKHENFGISSAYQHRYNQSRCFPQEKHIALSLLDEARCFSDAFFSSEDMQNFSIKMDGQAALASFFCFLKSLDESFALPLEMHEEYPLEKILHLFHFLAEFLSTGSEAHQESCMLSEAINAIENRFASFQTKQFRCASVFRLVKNILEKNTKNLFRAVSAPIIVAQFGSYNPFPVALLALLGADEGVLPEKDDEQLIQRMHLMSGDASFSNTHFEKYQFIEMLLHAQKLFISYKNYCYESREEKRPSILVEMLLQHIDKNYIFQNGEKPSAAIVQVHSLQERCCYSKKMKKYSWKDQEIPSLEKEEEREIDVEHLLWKARFLPTNYLKEQYGAFFAKDIQEQIFSSPRQEYALLLKKMDEKTSSSSKIAKGCLTQDALYACFLKMGIQKKDPIQVHLLPNVKTEQRTNNAFVTDLINCDSSIVKGTFSNQFLEGILCVSDNWKKELFDRYTEISLRAYLAEERGIPFLSQAILLQKEAIIPFQITTPFPKVLDLYHQSKKLFLPFRYEIVLLLLTDASDEEILEEVVETCSLIDATKYIPQLFSRDLLTSYIPVWKEQAQSLYAEFFSSLKEVLV